MFSLLFYGILLLALALGLMGLTDDALTFLRGRHYAGVHRYLHPKSPAGALRRADRQWMASILRRLSPRDRAAYRRSLIG